MSPLTPLVHAFVTHFGEMGSRWGINRTVGQIYALVYVSARPLNADDIADGLGFSRSNVSMGLKELQAWRLLRLKHLPGDRREYFEAPGDAWEVLRTLAEERRRREVEPTLTMLRDALMQPATNAADQHAQDRMRDMHGLIEMMMTWFDEVQRMDAATLAQLMKMGSRVGKLLEFTGTVKRVATGGKAKAVDAGGRTRADDAGGRAKTVGADGNAKPAAANGRATPTDTDGEA